MDAEPLESLIRQELVSKRSTLLSRCMEYLTQVEAISDLPGVTDWQQFLERSRDQLVTEIQTPESQPLNDRLIGSSFASLEALRAHSQQFANALSGWSEICEAAKNHPF